MGGAGAGPFCVVLALALKKTTKREGEWFWGGSCGGGGGDHNLCATAVRQGSLLRDAEPLTIKV